MITGTTYLVFTYALFLPALSMASASSARPVKAICKFSGHSTEGDRPTRKNVTEFGAETLVVNSGYDFGSKPQEVPLSWSGPKGKFFLAGSTSDPQEGWASFVLFFDYGSGKFTPVGIGSDLTVIKLIPNSMFTIRKRVGETSNPETWWSIEASCRLKNR